MHAFLVSTTPNLKNPFLVTPNDKNNIGIDEIKALQKYLSILPNQNQINYAVVIDAHQMTIPAQNSFLKTLEEPPSQSEIYLVTKNPDQLLPTILSRVEIQTKLIPYTSDSLEQSRILFQKLQNAGVGERLAVIDESGFDRDSFLHFLSDLEFILHSQLPKLPKFPQLPKLYSHLVQTKTYTQANCNMRLVIDYFASNLVLE